MFMNVCTSVYIHVHLKETLEMRTDFSLEAEGV